jgi:protein TonB
MPLTPEIAAAGITGSVSLEVVIDETGSVADAHLVRPAPLLENTAVATVRQWRFEPATLDGKPVPVRMNVVLNVRQ